MRADARFVAIAPFPAVVILVLLLLPDAWRPIHVIGMTSMLTRLALLTVARWQLGDAFSVAPKATTLVTRGLYSRIRNPVYVFGLVFFSGLILYVARPLLMLALIPLAAMQVVRARREARVLEERFGEAYRQYRARTWF